jgi:hypothetical protein
VPKAGPILKGKPLDRDYRVRLKWNGDARRYEVLEFTPASRNPKPPR